MNRVKLGIVGAGAMGTFYAQNIVEGKVPRGELAAICDMNPQRLEPFKSAERFVAVDDFLSSSETDAVLVATPHYSHTTIGIQVLGGRETPSDRKADLGSQVGCRTPDRRSSQFEPGICGNV
jgi:predicted dehydrogenase